MRRTTVIGILLLVIGVPIGLALIAVAIRSTGNNVAALQRVPYPDGGTITFAQAGEVTLYAETDHAVGKSSGRPDLIVTLAGANGPVLTSHPFDGSDTYNLAGHSGIATATLVVPAAGTYDLTVTQDDPGFRVVDLAVGEAVITPAGFVLPLVLGILFVVGSLVGGILTIVLPRVAAARHVPVDG